MELTQSELERWIREDATGKFHYKEVLDGQVSPELRSRIPEMMRRARDKGVATSIDGKHGWWRPVRNDLEEIAWQNLDGVIGENVTLPLELNDFCYIPLPSLIINAGVYNSGKTAFAINVVNLNLEKWENRIRFFVSEGAEIMKMKFNNLNAYIPVPAPFKMYRRTEHFADVIDPDGLNVIDYLRVNMEQSYAVSKELFDIFNKLSTGIAIVMMQKPKGDRKLAFGGAGTAFEPTLYTGMDNNHLGFEKIKVQKQLDYDPYNLKITFKISKGVNFYEVHREIQ